MSLHRKNEGRYELAAVWFTNSDSAVAGTMITLMFTAQAFDTVLIRFVTGAIPVSDCYH
jgi:hypothetical protein